MKSWKVFHYSLCLGRCIRVLSCHFWSAVLQFCARLPTNTLIKLLDSVVGGACFFTGYCSVVLHRRSVAVLCMLYMIRCNPMHPLYGDVSGPYMPVRVTLGALVANRRTYALASSLQNLTVPHDFYSPISNCGTILLSLYSMVWDRWVSRAGPMPFYLPSCSLHFCLLLCSFFLLSFYLLVLWGGGLRTYRVLIALSQSFIAKLF